MRFEFGNVFVGEAQFVIGDGQLVVGFVLELEESLWIGSGERVEAGDLVGREAGGVGEVLLEANGLVVAAIVQKFVEKLEGGEKVVLFQQKVHHAVTQRRTLHLHSDLNPFFLTLPFLLTENRALFASSYTTNHYQPMQNISLVFYFFIYGHKLLGQLLNALHFFVWYTS